MISLTGFATRKVVAMIRARWPYRQFGGVRFQRAHDARSVAAMSRNASESVMAVLCGNS